MTKYQTVKVRIIFGKGLATLVEYIDSEGYLARTSVKTTELQNVALDNSTALVSQTSLDQGVPYGLPFEYKFKERVITAKSIGDELHKVGIWTAEDIQKNTKGTYEAILSAAALSLSDVLALAQENLKEK